MSSNSFGLCLAVAVAGKTSSARHVRAMPSRPIEIRRQDREHTTWRFAHSGVESREVPAIFISSLHFRHAAPHFFVSCSSFGRSCEKSSSSSYSSQNDIRPSVISISFPSRIQLDFISYHFNGGSAGHQVLHDGQSTTTCSKCIGCRGIFQKESFLFFQRVHTSHGTWALRKESTIAF